MGIKLLTTGKLYKKMFYHFCSDVFLYNNCGMFFNFSEAKTIVNYDAEMQNRGRTL